MFLCVQVFPLLSGGKGKGCEGRVVRLAAFQFGGVLASTAGSGGGELTYIANYQAIKNSMEVLKNDYQTQTSNRGQVLQEPVTGTIENLSGCTQELGAVPEEV